MILAALLALYIIVRTIENIWFKSKCVTHGGFNGEFGISEDLNFPSFNLQGEGVGKSSYAVYLGIYHVNEKHYITNFILSLSYPLLQNLRLTFPEYVFQK